MRAGEDAKRSRDSVAASTGLLAPPGDMAGEAVPGSREPASKPLLFLSNATGPPEPQAEDLRSASVRPPVAPLAPPWPSGRGERAREPQPPAWGVLAPSWRLLATCPPSSAEAGRGSDARCNPSEAAGAQANLEEREAPAAFRRGRERGRVRPWRATRECEHEPDSRRDTASSHSPTGVSR